MTETQPVGPLTGITVLDLCSYLAGPYENLTLTKAGADESAKFVHELKAWVAKELAPVGGDNPAALDQALEHLARVALTDEEPVLAQASAS